MVAEGRKVGGGGLDPSKLVRRATPLLQQQNIERGEKESKNERGGGGGVVRALAAAVRIERDALRRACRRAPRDCRVDVMDCVSAAATVARLDGRVPRDGVKTAAAARDDRV